MRAQGSIWAAMYFGPIQVERSLEMLEGPAMQPDGLLAQTFSRSGRAALLGLAGRFDEAAAGFELAERLFQELGTPTRRAVREQLRAEFLVSRGDLEAAAEVLEEGHRALTELGETGFNSTIVGMLANVLADLGRWDEAESFARTSRELSASDDFASQVVWRTARARVLAHRGEAAESERLARAAIEIVEPTDYLTMQAEAREVLGIVLAEIGSADEARAAFEEALARFERKGHVPGAARVRGRIAAL
jgi:tetratricopeptide (TPR) repeat protein